MISRLLERLWLDEVIVLLVLRKILALQLEWRDARVLLGLCDSEEPLLLDQRLIKELRCGCKRIHRLGVSLCLTLRQGARGRRVSLRRRHCRAEHWLRLLMLGDSIVCAYRARAIPSVALPLPLEAREAWVVCHQAALDVLDAVSIHGSAVRERLPVLGHGDAVQLPFELAVLPHGLLVVVGGGGARVRLADVAAQRRAAAEAFFADPAFELLFGSARVFVLNCVVIGAGRLFDLGLQGFGLVNVEL